MKILKGKLQLAGIEVDCFTVEDGEKVSRVITDESCEKILGPLGVFEKLLSPMTFEYEGETLVCYEAAQLLEACVEVMKGDFPSELQHRCNRVLVKSLAKGLSIQPNVNN